MLLDKISKNNGKTITALTELIFRETRTPISTLKLNIHILKNLELVDFFNGDPVRLTIFGKFVFSLVAQNGVKASTVGCKPTGSCSIQGSGTKM
ncbi:MAG: hypothetical protein HY512_02580 [Candidatus Aenigmarchaeota archaeon]|nr:hypothetical protein [Candidatus Aenigmarchaeota archaeon]